MDLQLFVKIMIICEYLLNHLFLKLEWAFRLLLIFFFVKQNIGISWKFKLIAPLLFWLSSSESLIGQIFYIKFCHCLIVEFKPLIPNLNNWVIMPGLRCARMYDDCF